MPAGTRDIAIVLGGGGARAAYQVGALYAIAQIMGAPATLPFPIVCGTSAGAINATALALHADDFRRGVARLLRWWRNIDVADVYRADLGALSMHSAQFLASFLTGARPPAGVAALLDNAPLAQLLAREFTLGRIPQRIADGHLRALSINATSYTSGHALTFFDGAPGIADWQRARRGGRRTPLTLDHLLATTAIPFVFPAARVGDDYYMDGSVRQITPLSPALHLGARRVLVLAVGQLDGPRGPAAAAPAAYPSFAQAAGHALTTIFLDNLAADLERMAQINRLVDLVPAAAGGALPAVRVEALVLAPSRNIGPLALRYAEELPSAVRTLLRALGGTSAAGANLTSYLLFDRRFCRRLIELGCADTMARRDEIAAFVGTAA